VPAVCPAGLLSIPPTRTIWKRTGDLSPGPEAHPQKQFPPLAELPAHFPASRRPPPDRRPTEARHRLGPGNRGLAFTEPEEVGARSNPRSLAALALAVPLRRPRSKSTTRLSRLRATREWFGTDSAGRVRILEAARRERDDMRWVRTGPGSAAPVRSRPSRQLVRQPGPRQRGIRLQRRKVRGGRLRALDVRFSPSHRPDVLLPRHFGGGVWKT